MSRPLIKYKWSISVPDMAQRMLRQWTGEANAWDARNAVEVVLAIDDASELFTLIGIDPKQIIANTNPNTPNVLFMHLDEESGQMATIGITQVEEVVECQ